MKLSLAALVAGTAMFAASAAQADTFGEFLAGWTLYSDETVACVEAAAAEDLSPEKYAYLQSLFDDDLANSVDTYEEFGLNWGDAVETRGWLMTQPTLCVFE